MEHVQAMMCGFLYECLSRAGFACFDTLHVQNGMYVLLLFFVTIPGEIDPNVGIQYES